MTSPPTSASRLLEKRSLNLMGHSTSLALEPEFWAVLEQMAEGRSLAALIGSLDQSRKAERSLASTCRVAALEWLQNPLTLAPALAQLG